MVTDAILAVLGGILSLLAAVLPDMESLPWEAAVDDLEDFLESVGQSLGIADGVLPMSEAVAMVGFYVTYLLPAQLAYAVAMWVYSHIPVIGAG